MTARGTAFFIEPEGPLLAALRERKAWLEQTMPGQAFCSHPPHCTLLFGQYRRPGEWLEGLRKAVGKVPAFALETDAWQQFPNDALAGGGHTVAYRVRLTPALAALQRTVAECLAAYLTTDPAGHPLAGREPFAGSLRRYGSPFVGAHWIPHFTIASPRVAADAPLLAQLMGGATRHRIAVHSVSVWDVDGDRHERRHELALAGASA